MPSFSSASRSTSVRSRLFMPVCAARDSLGGRLGSQGVFSISASRSTSERSRCFMPFCGAPTAQAGKQG